MIEKPQVSWTPEIIEGIFEYLRRVPNITGAARSMGVSRANVYLKRAADPDFNAALEEALAEGVGQLKLEAHRRAYHGVPRVKISKGQIVYIAKHDEEGQPILDEEGNKTFIPLIEYEYSDTLMLALLSAHDPEHFSKKQDLKITAAGGAVLKGAGGRPSLADYLEG